MCFCVLLSKQGCKDNLEKKEPKVGHDQASRGVFLKTRIDQGLVDCFTGACQPPLCLNYSSKWRGTKAVAFVKLTRVNLEENFNKKEQNDVAYHLSCARQVASMKKETRRSCSA